MESSQYKNKKRRMSKSDLIYHVIMYTVFAVIGLICIYPFYYLLICTISNNKLVEVGKITFYPIGIHFQNYVSIFKLDNLLNATVVTLARTILSVIVNLMMTSYVAYLFTKQVMWKRKFWYRFVVITMYFTAGLIPVYLNIRSLGLLNKFWVYIVPGMISVYNMVLVKTYIESIPESLEESAQMDGAGYLTRYFRIILPLSKPILATVALFISVGEWNDFFNTKLYVTNPKLYTLQFLLYEYLQQINAAQDQIDNGMMDAVQLNATSIRLTLTAVVTIPIICVYPFIQKYYVKGIMLGSVKG